MNPFAGQPDWPMRPPRPIMPIGAADSAELRGHRVIVGLPGVGWRADLRADDRVVRGSRTYVPVIAEHEWYRAETEQVEVFAPLVPIERVWVERLGDAMTAAGERHSAKARFVSLDAPPCREPLPVMESGPICGRRVVQLVDGVERRDLRAVTEVHTGDDGDICLRVAPELEWYRWAWGGQSPRTMEVPVHLLWIE